MIALLITSMLTAAPSDMPERGWQTTNSPDEGIAKLQYFSGDLLHGDVYATCRPDTDGFIHFSAIAIGDTQETETIKVGGVTVLAPAQAEADPSGDFTGVMIPASHQMFDAMARGATIKFAGGSYPVSSSADRANIRRFIQMCSRSSEN